MLGYCQGIVNSAQASSPHRKRRVPAMPEHMLQEACCQANRGINVTGIRDSNFGHNATTTLTTTGRKPGEKSFRKLILYYADVHGKKFFGKSGALNPTLEKIIGKKRTKLVEIMLSDFQMT